MSLGGDGLRLEAAKTVRAETARAVVCTVGMVLGAVTAAVVLMAVPPPVHAPVHHPSSSDARCTATSTTCVAVTPYRRWARLGPVVRPYFPVAPSAMARNLHTHVETTGRVTLSKREKDGDWHLRITDGVGFVVAECIPELPCLHPRVGQCVKVRGISRVDGEHKWPEIHPVERLEVIPCPKM